MQNCPYCGKLTDPNLEACPHCGGSLRKTAPPGQRAGRGRQTCPNCKAMVQVGDIICVVCGTNLLTGQKISEEAKAPPAKDRRIPILIGVGILVLIIIVVGSLWAYVSTRDPFNQAMALVQANQFMDAQNVLAAHVERVPDDQRALYELGKLQWRNNQYGAAAATFERIVRLNPNDVESAFWAVASLELTEGAAQRGRQVQLLESIVAADPNNAQAWYLLALARGTQGDAAGQIEALERVVTLGHGNVESRGALGIGLALQGRFREANDELRMAATTADSAELVALQGFVSHMSGAEDDAVRHLRQAADQPGLSMRWEAQTQLGKLLLEQGQFREAEQHLRSALNIRANDELTRFLLGLTLKAMGNFQAALAELEGLSRDSRSFDVEATIQAADIYLTLNNPDRARATIDRVAPPSDAAGAPYFTVRGRILAATGDEAAAQDAFARAVNADPGYAPAYLESGLLYVRREALGQGLRELETYLRLLGPDAQGPQVIQIRELTNQIRQTTSQPPPAAGS